MFDRIWYINRRSTTDHLYSLEYIISGYHLYLLYVLGILGAGDIKLFSVIGGFTNFKTLTDCILATLLVGAIISVGKMLYNRNLQFSLFKGSVFIRELLHGNFMSYRKSMAQKENLMHFSVAILLGFMVVRVRMYM